MRNRSFRESLCATCGVFGVSVVKEKPQRLRDTAGGTERKQQPLTFKVGVSHQAHKDNKDHQEGGEQTPSVPTFCILIYRSLRSSVGGLRSRSQPRRGARTIAQDIKSWVPFKKDPPALKGRQKALSPFQGSQRIRALGPGLTFWATDLAPLRGYRPRLRITGNGKPL